MPGNKTTEQFDKAYAHLEKGEIERAATCFQHIIDNPNDFERYATSVAKQRLIWYCAPLELIVQAMRRTQGPVNISLLLKRLSETTEDYNKEEFSNFVKTVELELERGTYSENIGSSIWINKDYLEEQLSKLKDRLSKSSKPIKLDDYFRKAWKEFYLANPDFPDSNARTTLSRHIKNIGAEVLECEFILPDSFSRDFYDSLIKKINDEKKPISLSNYLMEFLNGTINTSTQKTIEKYLVLNLDNELVNYSKDFYVTRIILEFQRLESEIIQDLNSTKNALTTLEIIQKTFRTGGDLIPVKKFIDYVRSKLKENPELIECQQDTWFGKKFIENDYSNILRNIEKNESIFTLDELIKDAIGWGPEKEWFNQYKTLIKAKILDSKWLVRVTDDRYMFINNVNAIVQDIFNYLANDGPQKIEGIIQHIERKRDTRNILNTFAVYLEKQLSNDQRFKNIRGTWTAVNPWEVEHDKIISYLIENKNLMTIEEMLNLPFIDKKLIAIDKDERFKMFPNGKWGLNSWIWINDLVYDYLLRTQQRLHDFVVIHKICEEKGYSENTVIFLPAEDSRFSQDNLNRWYCRHKLTEEEIEKLLQELAHYGGIGRRLSQLTNAILHLEPDATDAEEVLNNDPRFIELEDIWYNRDTVYQVLTSDEIQKIFEQLNLRQDEQPISTKDLGANYLGCDGRLTNLAELLRLDERFVEVNPDYWILFTWNPGNFDRIPLGGAPAVRNSQDDQAITTQSGESLPKLTKRGADKVDKSTEKESKNKLNFVLRHLDIYYGNIRITDKLRTWIPENAQTIRIIDEYDSEVIGFINETLTILSLKDFIQKRNLSYGDKISIQPGAEPGSLRIIPYGPRNEKVYQEAINHKNIEKLIEEAKRVNKSYHDLMIEVMEDMAIPLHREDIFQLVDYQRTASRNTISEILSLSECPYEELRYFVGLGNGMWIFDRKKKEAFDMKMKELEQENTALIRKIAKLTEFENEIKQSKTKIKELEAKKTILENHNQDLQKQITEIKANLNAQEPNKKEINNTIASLERTIRNLGDEKSKLSLKNAELKQIVESLQREFIKQKKTIDETHATEERMQQLTNTQIDLSMKITKAEEEINNLNNRNLSLKNEIEAKGTEIERLKTEGQNNLELLKNYEKIIERQTRKEKIKLKELLDADQKDNSEEKTKLIQDNQNLAKRINELENEKITISEKLTEVEIETLNLKQERLELIKQKDDEIRKFDQMSKRLITIEKALSSPIGRFLSKFLGLKKTV